VAEVRRPVHRVRRPTWRGGLTRSDSTATIAVGLGRARWGVWSEGQVGFTCLGGEFIWAVRSFRTVRSWKLTTSIKWANMSCRAVPMHYGSHRPLAVSTEPMLKQAVPGSLDGPHWTGFWLGPPRVVPNFYD
jgi:hypothetical protein